MEEQFPTGVQCGFLWIFVIQHTPNEDPVINYTVNSNCLDRSVYLLFKNIYSYYSYYLIITILELNEFNVKFRRVNLLYIRVILTVTFIKLETMLLM